jgi:transcription antitermination factor NusG
MMNSWSLLRLNPQSQTKYVEHVQENVPDVETYYPVFEKKTRPHGRRHPMVVVRPVYPGYVFACLDMNGASVHLLMNSPIKARFIRFGGGISLIPSRVIDELRRLESQRMLIREIHINPYMPGKKVRVHLPVADISAIILSLLHGKRALVETPLGRMSVQLHKMTLV